MENNGKIKKEVIKTAEFNYLIEQIEKTYSMLRSSEDLEIKLTNKNIIKSIFSHHTKDTLEGQEKFYIELKKIDDILAHSKTPEKNNDNWWL